MAIWAKDKRKAKEEERKRQEDRFEKNKQAILSQYWNKFAGLGEMRCQREGLLGCGKALKETQPFHSQHCQDEYFISHLCQDCQDLVFKG